jgi:rhamnosyltransferase
METMGDKANIEVSIVIPARNEGENIGQCLQAIDKQETPYTFEIIVIDSGSTDNTIDIVNKYPLVRLVQIEPGEFGHGKTRNLGAEMAKGHYIVFLNADAIPVNADWLNPLIGPLTRDKTMAGVFSRHVPKDDCYLYMVRDLQNAMPGKKILRTHAGKMDFMLFSTVSAAVSKETWQQFPFDNDIIIAEDQDWAKKVLNNGKKILYEPASMVSHSHNYTPRQLMENKRKIARASGRFKNRFTALTVGFILVAGGIFVKIMADMVFILFKTPQKIPFPKKIKEIKISLIARFAGFRGRYKGWIGR